MKTFIRKPLAVAVGLAIQSTSMQAQEATSGAALEEIVVTANRRTESVLEVPYNITALSADQLEAAGVSDISGMVRMVPGLSSFDEGPRVSGNRNNFNIRGLNANTLGNEDDNPRIGQATVSTYVGETPVFFPLKLVDLDRVEVLRGPQGTLYGSGSVGGTVRFIPNKPDFDGFTLDVNAEASLTKKSDDVGYEGNLPSTYHSAKHSLCGLLPAMKRFPVSSTPWVWYSRPALPGIPARWYWLTLGIFSAAFLHTLRNRKTSTTPKLLLPVSVYGSSPAIGWT